MDVEGSINKYKNIIANVVVLAVALFIAVKIYNIQMQKIAVIKGQAETEQKKNKVLKNIDELGNKVKAYTDSINNKDLSSILSTLGELARASGVEITSIRPAGEEDQEAFIKYPYELRLMADNYHNIGKYIADLESHRDIFLIESVNMASEPGAQSSDLKRINVDLRVSTILLKK